MLPSFATCFGIAFFGVLNTGVLSTTSGNNQTQINKWLLDALSLYPAWVDANSLDPSPVTKPPLFITVNTAGVKLDLELRNYFVQHFCKKITTASARCFMESNSLEFSFSCSSEFPARNVVFEGEYTAIVTLNSSIAITKTGKWKLIHGEIYQSVHFDYNITPAGYINITNKKDRFLVSPYFYGVTGVEFYGLFDNISKGDYGILKNAISENFDEMMRFNNGRNYPATEGIFLYFTELFQRTSIDEILGRAPPVRQPSCASKLGHFSVFIITILSCCVFI